MDIQEKHLKRCTTPERYSHDHQTLVDFFKQTDANGVSNGQKLGSNLTRYNPDDKNTWGFYALTGLGVTWSIVSSVTGIYFYNLGMVGLLSVRDFEDLKNLECGNNSLTLIDVAGCKALTGLCCDYNKLTELDTKGNTALEYLDCSFNNLTVLDVSNNTSLQYLDCYYNKLIELDVSRNTALSELGCSGNNLSELDISRNTALEYLACDGNKLTELDASNTKLPIDYIHTKGKGYIGYAHRWHDGTKINILYAYHQDGESFLGWYNEDGELLSTNAEWDITDRTEKVFIAKFTNKATFTEVH